MIKSDNIYKEKQDRINPFAFDRNTAEAFNDMANRSIPAYREMQEVIAKTAIENYQIGTSIYDIGCSTGNTITALQKYADKELKIIAMDKSPDMIKLAKKQCSGYSIEWICDSIENLKYSNASVIIVNYVLQFVAPEMRADIIYNMYKALVPDGILILGDKLCSQGPALNEILKKRYYDFKRMNGYSDLEIEQKEKALKNVLIPYNIDQYKKIFINAGFKEIEIVFKYFQFTLFMAIK